MATNSGQNGTAPTTPLEKVAEAAIAAGAPGTVQDL